ncbi:SMI1/KNR4 family protein [Myxococcus sp. AM009]|uniref:SMI1/KNR4 family protein n=1 Tax=unclassified Myxococcus TaxID=2648731 RepID=UPI0015962395|nr:MULTISPECIES: SMI1/KNR4 family protein [unclassified Myxococcus]NVI98036.1 SMI1/KNR4 family protein [Myxococcus sp. AM009]NVJ15676.1 SMI1/KNR4 family protein [Myxococcus sp. AM010]
MSRAIDSILALQERLKHERELPLKSVSLTPVPSQDLHMLESSLGALLPQAYLDFISRHGLFSAVDWRGQERARMLSPTEVLETLQWSKAYVEEGAFGDNEDELEAALLERKLRGRLIPFQYIAWSNVSDYYYFDTGMRRDTGPLIFPARHDDFDLSTWLLDGAPDVSGCTFDFDEHLRWVLRASLEEKDWGR